MTLKKHNYIPLYCHSLYSFGESSIRVNQLIDYCKKYDIPAIGVADNGNLFGAFDITNSLVKEGIQPIIGINLNLVVKQKAKFEDDRKEGYVTFLATSEKGYKTLLKLVYRAYIENNEAKNDSHLLLSDLSELNEDLILLTGAKNSFLSNILQDSDLTKSVVENISNIFGNNFYIQIERQQEPNEQEKEQLLLNTAKQFNIPIVATNEAFYAKQEDYDLHDTYMCITQGVTVFQEDREKLNINSYLKSPQEMQELFKDLPEALENTVNIAKKCCFLLKSINPQFPKYSDNEVEELKQKVKDGLEKRLKAKNIDPLDEKYNKRLEYELGIILNMHFEGYFLIVYDFINYAKSNGIPVGPGRGSGAGSLVAYCLGITDIDPLEFDLLFERFLNPERISMPDFDIDFCPEGRDKVIDYVRKKYGEDHVAQIITFGRLQSRGAVRDTGRALGFAYSEVDRLSKKIPQGTPSNPVTLEQALKEDEGLRDYIEGNERLEQLCDYSMKTEGLYRNISTHAAGVVIAYKPLNETIPVYMNEGQELPLTGYSMKYIENAGLVKFDFLGLKTLTIVSLTVENIAKYNNNIAVDVDNISYFDEKTCNLLGSGKTMGIFQVEGEGVRKILTQLKPSSIHDIIAIISLYRPGPIENIPSYIKRKHGSEKVVYQHELMKDVIEDTYGIMIYQEQVMKIAQVIAGYSLGSADILRRAMGKKDKEQMAFEEQRFVEGALKTNNINERLAKEIFNQIEKFAGYGFNKSHAAAYAFISWQTAYLKAYYPEEFFISIMTLNRSSQEDICNFVYEAKEFGIQTLGVSINSPSENFQIETNDQNKKVIRYSIPAIKGISEKLATEIRLEFEQNGRYKSVRDFFKRVNFKALNKRQLRALIHAGAFDDVETNRKKLVENVDHLMNFAKSSYEAKHSNQISLFGNEDNEETNNNSNGNNSNNNTTTTTTLEQDDKDIFQNNIKDNYTQKEQLFNEKDVVGFFIDKHPLSALEGYIKQKGYNYYNYMATLNTKESYNNIEIIGTLMEVSLTRSNRGMRAYLFKISDPSTGMYSLTLPADVFDKMNISVEPNNHYLFKIKAKPSNNSEDEHWISIASIKHIDENKVIKALAKQQVGNVATNNTSVVNNGNVANNIIGNDIANTANNHSYNQGIEWGEVDSNEYVNNTTNSQNVTVSSNNNKEAYETVDYEFNQNPYPPEDMIPAEIPSQYTSQTEQSYSSNNNLPQKQQEPTGSSQTLQQAGQNRLKLYINIDDIITANLYLLKQQFLSISGTSEADVYITFNYNNNSQTYFIQKIKLNIEKVEEIKQNVSFIKSVKLV